MTRPRHSGSLRLRNGIWLARYYHRGRQVEESTGYSVTDRGKAETFLHAKVKEANTARFVDPATRKLTVDDLLDVLRREHTRLGNRSRLKLRHLVDDFGGAAALAVTTEDVDRYTDARLAAGAQPATVNRELAALRRAFRLAVQKHLLPSMPHITLRPEDNVRQGFLDPADWLAFLAALREADTDVADATEFAYRTVLRRGNVLGAVWPWFTLDVQRGHVIGGGIRLPGRVTKNKKPLTLPLTGALLALVDRRWQLRVATCPHVFQRGGIPLTRFDAVWRQAAAAIGRPGFLFHDLRRSAARTLRRAGIDEETIMRLGGWKTRSMFSRYAIVDERDLAEAQAKLDAVLTPTAPRQVVPLRGRRRR